MSERYAREILRRNIAQICQTIGWNGIHSTPLDILVHLLEKYLRTIGTQTSRYAEQFNRTEPNLHDLGLVFRDLSLQISELAEYTCSVPTVPPPMHVEKFPKLKESHLNFLKPGSYEVVTRPMHVHEHLPPMYPEKERDTLEAAGTVEIRQNVVDNVSNSKAAHTNPEISVTDSPEKTKDLFKRPTGPVFSPNNKRARLRLEEEERTREISSVMMTMSGFLSPAREGKLPEARPPSIISEKHCDKHKIASHHLQTAKVPVVEKSDKKAKKCKLLNGKIIKGKRKGKSRKGECGKLKDCSKFNKYPARHFLKSQESNQLPNSFIPSNNVPSAPDKLADAPRTSPSLSEAVKMDIKQEPIYVVTQDSKNIIPGEEAIPVPRKIPIYKSPLAYNTVAVSQPMGSSFISGVEVKKETLVEQEKLTSQPDRSKINIFKRISNKCKEEKNTGSEVLPEKSQSDDVISKQLSVKVYSDEMKTSENVGIKIEETIVSNNDNCAVHWSKEIDLRAHEVINIDDESLDITPVSAVKLMPEDPHPRTSVNKNFNASYSKDEAKVIQKVKKEKKHRDKKDKAAKLEAKMLKKQQDRVFAMAHSDQHSLKSRRPQKSRRPKNVSSVSQMSAGFSFFPALPTSGRNLIPGPGLEPIPSLSPSSNFLAGLGNNQTMRGLAPSNFLSNSFALDAGCPGLIPGPSFLPGNFGPGVTSSIMPVSNYSCSSGTMSVKISPLLRRPSLEVIPVENVDERSPHKSVLMSQEKERHNKHEMAIIPNIFQQHHEKSNKDHKAPLKLSPVQPDITIELNPPKEILKQVATKEISPPPLQSSLPQTVQVLPKLQPPSNLIESQHTEVAQPKETAIIEEKKDKLRKKEKKGRECLKIKKKKDKKVKNKNKSEKKREKEERHEIKEKIKKEKKEKMKEKSCDGLVPKLTLKLYSSNSNSPMPPTSPDVFRLNIKPLVKKEEPESSVLIEEPLSREHSYSPELAQISALVTRPPKQKHLKYNHAADSEAQSSPPSESSPTRKNHPPSSNSKYKRILFKPLSRKGHFEDVIASLSDDPALLQSPPPTGKQTGPLPSPYYLDTHGNKIWVCPACGQPDNGSPMIGCDGCDGWYHWVCVGITEEPGATEDWFCKLCLAKRTAVMLSGGRSTKKRGRKSKGEKIRDCP